MCDADAYLMPSHCLAKFSEFNMLVQDYADFGDRADEMDTETAHKAARSATTKKRNKHAKLDTVTQLSNEEFKMWQTDKEYIQVHHLILHLCTSSSHLTV